MTDHLSDNYQDRLNNIIEINEKIFLVGLKSYRQFPDGVCDKPIDFVFQNYLERFVFNFETINLLLKEYRTKPTTEHSIGILIRSSLLDFITIQYLSSYGFDKADEELFIKTGNSILCDHIHNTFHYYKLLGTEAEAEFKEVVDSVRNLFPYLFDDKPVNYADPKKNLIAEQLCNPTTMFKRIKEYEKTKPFATVYELYSYYSKYEHFGILSHHFQKRGEDSNFHNMIWGIVYIIMGIEISLGYLSDKQDTMPAVKEIQLLRKQFADQIPEAIKM